MMDEELAEIMTNHFAEGFLNALKKLEERCEQIMRECTDRKNRLTHALIWEK